MITWRTVVLIGLLPFLGSAWQRPSVPSVEFFLTDNFGNAIPSGRVQIISEGGTSSRRLVYPESKAIKLPAGRYTVIVVADGFLTNSEQITLSDKDVFLPVSLTLAPIEGTEVRSSLTVTVGKKLRDSTPVWIRLAGVYKDINWDAKINDDGKFAFSDLPPGEYVLMIFGRGVLKVTRTISVRAYANQITIE